MYIQPGLCFRKMPQCTKVGSEGEGRETSSSYQFRGLNLSRLRFSPPQDEENNCMYLGGSLRLK